MAANPARTATQTIVRPQPGYQLRALSSPADIVIGGAAAGVGKTYSLLLEPLRHIQNPDFGAVCFRRTSPQIRAEGGLWHTSLAIYPAAGATPRETTLDWNFGAGARVSFRHLQYEKDVLQWQGSQIALIMFDELTHFSESMFFYMLSRNRSTCGVKPYVRATCNPDPDSWVSRLIAWWIDEQTGLPIPERDGVIRYFAKYGDSYCWGDTPEECIAKAWYFLETLVEKSGQPATDFIKSLTFISGSIYDNRALLSRDPSYLANLSAQDEATRKQLLEGNWKVVLSDLDLFDYPAFLDMFSESPGQSVKLTTRAVTADIAGMGSDRFVVGAWHGTCLAEGVVMEKSTGPEVVETIQRVATAHGVPATNIVYDADGIGGLLNGFLPGAKAFHGGARAVETRDDSGKKAPENYANLRTQCYYRLAAKIKKGEIHVAPEAASVMFDAKTTLRQRLLRERGAIKRYKADSDGKLRILPKEEIKLKLGGSSPDVLDMLIMREVLDLKPARQWHVA